MCELAAGGVGRQKAPLKKCLLFGKTRVFLRYRWPILRKSSWSSHGFCLILNERLLRSVQQGVVFVSVTKEVGVTVVHWHGTAEVKMAFT